LINVLCSPAEPADIRASFETSAAPEALGVDFLWSTGDTAWGVQRKAFPSDFLASLRDDRIAKELGQMQSLGVAVLILEGVPRWIEDKGRRILYGERTKFSETQLIGILASLQMLHNIQVFWSDDHAHTVRLVQRLAKWSVTNEGQTALTSSLKRRNKPDNNKWGTRESEDWVRWVLQSFPGVGQKVADAIIQHFGYLPLTWTVTQDEIMEVPGVGKKIAKALIETLDESFTTSDKS